MGEVSTMGTFLSLNSLVTVRICYVCGISDLQGNLNTHFVTQNNNKAMKFDKHRKKKKKTWEVIFNSSNLTRVLKYSL